MDKTPIVFIEAPSRSLDGSYSVFRCENGSQAWNVAQGVLTLEAAQEIALVIAKHLSATMLARVDAKIANPAESYQVRHGYADWDEANDSVKERTLGRWYEERNEILARTPERPEQVLVRQ